MAAAQRKDFTTILTRSFEQAAAVLEVAKFNSANFSTSANPYVFKAVSAKAHFFLRITLYNTKKKSLSALHIGDLIGFSLTDDGLPERVAVKSSLGVFRSLVGEMARETERLGVLQKIIFNKNSKLS